MLLAVLARLADRQDRRARLGEADTRADGQAAGLASNVAARHAFCSVVSREGSFLGRATLTFAMFACEPNGSFG